MGSDWAGDSPRPESGDELSDFLKRLLCRVGEVRISGGWISLNRMDVISRKFTGNRSWRDILVRGSELSFSESQNLSPNASDPNGGSGSAEFQSGKPDSA